MPRVAAGRAWAGDLHHRPAARRWLRTPPRSLARSLLALALLACHPGPGHRGPADRAGEGRSPTPASGQSDAASTHSDASGTAASATAPARPPYRPPSTLGPAIEQRLITRTRAVYTEPSTDAPLRGRVPSKQRVHVYATREAPGCDAPWAQVADAGWICLEHSEPSEQAPESLPLIGDGDLLPFIYARHRRHEAADTPPIPVYRSLRQLNAGADPIDTLPAYGSYAFVRYTHNRGKPALITDDRHAVAAAELQRFEASEFAGRDLLADPVPAAATLAWAVRWKTEIRRAPDPEAEAVGRVPYHETIFLAGADPSGAWFEIADDDPSRRGWVAAEDIRRWRPQPPDDPILAGQILLDVDLDQQVLTVWREDQPVFVTLISSGKPGDRTPPGLYRIETKWAFSKMASLEDADDPYWVDAVPWAMYFDGRYALHAAFWHDLFGHQASHGCVNLSPRDAKRIFEWVTPTLPLGWLLVHEHPSDPGALVRVRRDGHATPDRRHEWGEDERSR